MGIFVTNSLPSNILFCGNDKLNCEKVKGKRGRAGETRWNQSKNIDKMNNAAGYLKTQNEKCTHTHTHTFHTSSEKIKSRCDPGWKSTNPLLPLNFVSFAYFFESLSISLLLFRSMTRSLYLPLPLPHSRLWPFLCVFASVSASSPFFLRGNASVRRIHVWYDWITLKRVNGLKCQSWTETFQYVPATTV